jgi:hypothetical protein
VKFSLQFSSSVFVFKYEITLLTSPVPATLLFQLFESIPRLFSYSILTASYWLFPWQTSSMTLKRFVALGTRGGISFDPWFSGFWNLAARWRFYGNNPQTYRKRVQATKLMTQEAIVLVSWQFNNIEAHRLSYATNVYWFGFLRFSVGLAWNFNADPCTRPIKGHWPHSLITDIR